MPGQCGTTLAPPRRFRFVIEFLLHLLQIVIENRLKYQQKLGNKKKRLAAEAAEF